MQEVADALPSKNDIFTWSWKEEFLILLHSIGIQYNFLKQSPLIPRSLVIHSESDVDGSVFKFSVCKQIAI